MSIKIYLPTDYFYLKRGSHLYGQVQISDDNVVVYYVVDEDPSSNPMEYHGMQFLGTIWGAEANNEVQHHHQHDMRLCFTYSQDTPNISLIYVGITPESLKQIKLILYDKAIVRNLLVTSSNASQSQDTECDFLQLFRLMQAAPLKTAAAVQARQKSNLQLIHSCANMPIYLFRYLVEKQFIYSIMMHTFVYKHYKEWLCTYEKGSRWTNIMLDRVLGLILMLVLFMLVSHPGDFLIQISHGIINQLYALLKVLEGSPIGLKLNIHLNNFFLDCFKYHIELWSTFLDLIEPIVRQVFLAIGVFGCLGLTYQIALLADLITIVGLHAHCFYVYTKVLYNVEKKGLAVLWQVVRGNRFNILKGRTEAHNYMNRQLYLATIFFSAILFLFPTTLVYYIVFATLKALTYATLSIFDYCRRQILTFPIETRFKWIKKGFHEMDCLKLQDISLQKQSYLLHNHYQICVSTYKLQG